jgi:hypothetical protein
VPRASSCSGPCLIFAAGTAGKGGPGEEPLSMDPCVFTRPARTRYRCNTQAMSTTQNRNRTGRFPKGVCGNPGGRPQGLARATRELVGEDGMALAQLWWDIARDETQRSSDRPEASRLLADRGWGKAPTYAAIEEADRSTLPTCSRRRRISGKESFGSLRGNRIPPNQFGVAGRAPLGAHPVTRLPLGCRDVRVH